MSKLRSPDAPRVGLVLSGGGAKGAYQVGVLKALNELEIHVDLLAGASIGALNGAIIAAAPNQGQAAQNLERLWLELAACSPVSLNTTFIKWPVYLALLGGFGLTSPILGAVSTAARTATGVLNTPWLQDVSKRLAGLVGVTQWLPISDAGLLCDKRVSQLIAQFLGDSGLPNRLPLFVSVYPSQGAGIDLLRIVGSELYVSESLDSQFFHVQSMPLAEQKKLLLASAALPLLFTPQEVNGQLYTDGGQGGWSSVQGNTPITPLIDAGCSHAIVTHLADGSFWSRQRFPDTTIIEIRPKTAGIGRTGAVRDLLGFDNTKIPSWIQQGYVDTVACVEPIVKTLRAFGALHRSEQARDQAVASTGAQRLREAMRRLDGG